MALLAHRLAKSLALASGLIGKPPTGLTVLLYHRIGAGERNIDLSTDAFERQLAYLSEHCTVVPLAEGLERASNSLDEDLIALSFDDGTDDFHIHALPLLERYGLPAINYVTTRPVHERTPLRGWGRHTAPAMTWAQLGECVDSGLVEIGSHTHTHADLDRVPADQAAEELRRSQELICHHLQRPCRHFAYPHAVYTPGAEALVRERYDTAAVGGWTKNAAGRVDHYRITRIPVTRADGPVYFRAKLAGRMGAERFLYAVAGKRG